MKCDHNWIPISEFDYMGYTHICLKCTKCENNLLAKIPHPGIVGRLIRWWCER